MAADGMGVAYLLGWLSHQRARMMTRRWERPHAVLWYSYASPTPLVVFAFPHRHFRFGSSWRNCGQFIGGAFFTSWFERSGEQTRPRPSQHLCGSKVSFAGVADSGATFRCGTGGSPSERGADHPSLSPTTDADRFCSGNGGVAASSASVCYSCQPESPGEAHAGQGHPDGGGGCGAPELWRYGERDHDCDH